MAICNIIDDPGRSAEEYEQITTHVRGSGPTPPEGCRLVLVSRERAITVWDSPEDRDRFLAQRLAPAYQSVGRSLDEVTNSLSSTLTCSSQATLPAWSPSSSGPRADQYHAGSAPAR
jgi:hypothetical protein